MKISVPFEDSFPYWCVKGKAKVKISEEQSNNVSIVEKIAIKYLDSLDHPWAERMVEMAKEDMTKTKHRRFVNNILEELSGLA